MRLGFMVFVRELSLAVTHKKSANIIGTVGYNNNSYDNVIAARYGAEIEQSIDLIAATRRLKKEGVLEKATLTCAYETQ